MANEHGSGGGETSASTSDSHGENQSAKDHGGHGKSGHSHRAHSGEKSFAPFSYFAAAIVFVLLILYIFEPGIFYENWFLIVAGIVLVFLIYRYDYVLQLKEYQRAIVFTFGRVSKVVGPGWAIVFPPIQSTTTVDLRTKVIDIPPQRIVTKDGVEVRADGLVYIKIKKDSASVLKSVLEVEDYESASKSYVLATLRDVIGAINLTEVLTNVEEIDKDLRVGLQKISDSWGVEIEAVKIQEIKIPETVLEAMHEEKAALQQKLATFQRAAAHEREIEAVRTAAENLSDRALAYYYVKALEKIGEGSSTKFVLPLELTRLVESVSGKKFSLEDISGFLSQAGLAGQAVAVEKKKRLKKKN